MASNQAANAREKMKAFLAARTFEELASTLNAFGVLDERSMTEDEKTVRSFVRSELAARFRDEYSTYTPAELLEFTYTAVGHKHDTPADAVAADEAVWALITTAEERQGGEITDEQLKAWSAGEDSGANTVAALVAAMPVLQEIANAA
jgi:hypothetical protein